MRAEERARELLKAAGLLVYDPGQHTGPCKAPYVVVHSYGNNRTVGSRRLTYSLLLIRCYVPLNGKQGPELGALASRVKTIMRDMRRQAIPTGQEGPDMIEENFNALSKYIEYQILKANKE